MLTVRNYPSIKYTTVCFPSSTSTWELFHKWCQSARFDETIGLVQLNTGLYHKIKFSTRSMSHFHFHPLHQKPLANIVVSAPPAFLQSIATSEYTISHQNSKWNRCNGDLQIRQAFYTFIS